MAITRESLSYEIGDLLELPRAARHGKAYDIINALLDSISNALHSGQSVRVEGFGTFKVIKRAPRRRGVARFYSPGNKNPYRETVITPSKLVVKFYPSAALERYINEPQS